MFGLLRLIHWHNTNSKICFKIGDDFQVSGVIAGNGIIIPFYMILACGTLVLLEMYVLSPIYSPMNFTPFYFWNPFS